MRLTPRRDLLALGELDDEPRGVRLADELRIRGHFFEGLGIGGRGGGY